MYHNRYILILLLYLQEFLLHLPLAVLTIEKKRDIEEDLRLFLNKFNEEKNSDDKEKIIMIKLLGGPNKNIPALSKFVKLKYSESMGRCLVVTSNINPGKHLMVISNYYNYGNENMPVTQKCRVAVFCYPSLPKLRRLMVGTAIGSVYKTILKYYHLALQPWSHFRCRNYIYLLYIICSIKLNRYIILIK